MQPYVRGERQILSNLTCYQKFKIMAFYLTEFILISFLMGITTSFNSVLMIPPFLISIILAFLLQNFNRPN